MSIQIPDQLDTAVLEDGITAVASVYDDTLQAETTASGERYNPEALTASHRVIPFGTRLLVVNPSTRKSVIVKVNDRGPFGLDRDLDLSREAGARIGLDSHALTPVIVAVLP